MLNFMVVKHLNARESTSLAAMKIGVRLRKIPLIIKGIPASFLDIQENIV
jgi:hypothetical protein